MLILRSASGRVSKDGGTSVSFETPLSAAPQDELNGGQAGQSPLWVPSQKGAVAVRLQPQRYAVSDFAAF